MSIRSIRRCAALEFSPVVKRLAERFPVGALVEIEINGYGWQAGRVVQHDHPGLWVKMIDGRIWFVTNGRKIRAAGGRERDES